MLVGLVVEVAGPPSVQASPVALRTAQTRGLDAELVDEALGVLEGVLGHRRLDLGAVEVGQVVDDDVGGGAHVGEPHRPEVLRDALEDGDLAVVGADEVLALGPVVGGIETAADDEEHEQRDRCSP